MMTCMINCYTAVSGWAPHIGPCTVRSTVALVLVFADRKESVSSSYTHTQQVFRIASQQTRRSTTNLKTGGEGGSQSQFLFLSFFFVEKVSLFAEKIKQKLNHCRWLIDCKSLLAGVALIISIIT